jgi:D-3-phosphoglycerate dehydrogenase
MKAIVVGDNLIPADMILSRAGPLRDAGYAVQAFDWMFADRNEMNRRNLNLERYGPETEPPPEGLLDAVQDAEILVVQFSPVPRAVVEAGKMLKAIGVARAGWENINVEAATQRGIAVVHIVGRNANAVAEHTVGLILCEMRNLARSHCALQSGEWISRKIDPLRTFELAGKTLGLVGFGTIGQLVARRLAGFDMRLLVYDPFVPASLVLQAGGKPVSLPALLRQADVVSLHARLAPETEGLIGRAEFAQMKPTAYLVNSARAGLIVQDALVEALQQRRIAGAALDVYWQEPLPADHPLTRLTNVTLTSHLAGTTLDALHNTIDQVIEGVLGVVRQGKIDTLVNPEVIEQAQACPTRLGPGRSI